MAVPYHTHDFEIPVATKDDVVAGVSNSKALTPASVGNAAARNVEDFATAEQGVKASTAVQPEDLAKVATTGDYNDLNNLPVLGSVASRDITEVATAAQGALADTAVQPHDIGSAAAHDEADFATAEQGLKAESALQPDDVKSAAHHEASDFAMADQVLPSGGSAGQVLAKKSGADRDSEWVTVDAAAAVSYAGPQVLEEEQKETARGNIDALGYDDATDFVKRGGDILLGTLVGNTRDGHQAAFWVEASVTPFSELFTFLTPFYADANGIDGYAPVMSVRASSTENGGICCWSQGPDGAAFDDLGDPCAYRIVCNDGFSSISFTFGGDGSFKAEGPFFSTASMIAGEFIQAGGQVIAGNGSATLNPDGNVTGPRWGHSHLYDWIESRCAAFADHRRNGCVTDSRLAGWMEWDTASLIDETWNQSSGYVLTGLKKSRNSIAFGAQQPQVFIPYVGWRAVGAN